MPHILHLQCGYFYFILSSIRSHVSCWLPYLANKITNYSLIASLLIVVSFLLDIRVLLPYPLRQFGILCPGKREKKCILSLPPLLPSSSASSFFPSYRCWRNDVPLLPFIYFKFNFLFLIYIFSPGGWWRPGPSQHCYEVTPLSEVGFL